MSDTIKNKWKHCNFEELLGKTITKIETMSLTDEKMIFETDDAIFRMIGSSDCCAYTYIESIDGDIEDLIGEPIMQAECVLFEGDSDTGEIDIRKWCFYKLATIKGYVTIRWNESNNGYYSVEVKFEKLEK